MEPRPEIGRALIAWFEANARDLPWRRTRDPYAIWVSEVMLQQTRVDTVIPYFHRFLERFPTPRALAEAPLDEVLSAWSGLGYYRRARVLHLAAREITTRFGGALPSTAEELRSLPGVGPYTAGAVSSLAFDRAEPLVDGNVARVLSRVLGFEEPVGGTASTKRLWDAARALLPAGRAGRFNEALMELGATVCTPRGPRCEGCPLEQLCVARRDDRVDELPVILEKKATKTVRMVAIVVASRGRVLLAKREADGLFGGMWEPPMVEATRAEAGRAALGLELGDAKLTPSGKVRHILSHRTLEVSVARVVIDRPKLAWTPASPYVEARFVDASDLGDTGGRAPGAPGLGVSTLARKVLVSKVETRPRKKSEGSSRGRSSKPQERK